MRRFFNLNRRPPKADGRAAKLFSENPLFLFFDKMGEKWENYDSF